MWDFFKGLFGSLLDFLWSSADNVWKSVTHWGVVGWGAFAALMAFFTEALETVSGWLTEALSNVTDALTVPELAAPGALGFKILGLANFMFPVAEFFALMGVYFGAMIGMGIYRFVKSWIPTLS